MIGFAASRFAAFTSFACFRASLGNPIAMTANTSTEVVLRNDPLVNGFLPEGPIQVSRDELSWVGIQHGAAATHGSLNWLNLVNDQTQSLQLSGRPGFAFPTDDPKRYIVGLERDLVILDRETGNTSLLVGEIDQSVDGTIINDGVLTQDGVVFGCKDLKFAEQKAGLYWWDQTRQSLFQLSSEQTCSNGKVVLEEDDSKLVLLDIDTPTQCVKSLTIDKPSGTLASSEVVLDLADEVGFPDGMIGTPDKQGVIIAFFNPEPADFGMAKWFELASGDVKQIWKTDASPQVTCPCLINRQGTVQLLLTTAAENMSDEQRTECPNAGCLFVGPTTFADLPAQPRFPLSVSQH